MTKAMLTHKNVMATVAVKDLGAARRFYESTLGLEVTHVEGDGAIEFKCGSSTLLVYVSQYAGTNQATAATWNLGGDLEDIVEGLRAKGVKFEHYDNMPETKLVGDIHVAGNHKMAWFKDPDGNIHGLLGQ